jgi:hypothetical protein
MHALLLAALLLPCCCHVPCCLLLLLLLPCCLLLLAATLPRPCRQSAPRAAARISQQQPGSGQRLAHRDAARAWL